jgi:hypothetical protein
MRREVLYNILIEFEVPMKTVRLIKMCLNETYSKVRVGNLFLSPEPKWLRKLTTDSWETFVSTYQTMRCHNPENIAL